MSPLPRRQILARRYRGMLRLPRGSDPYTRKTNDLSPSLASYSHQDFHSQGRDGCQECPFDKVFRNGGCEYCPAGTVSAGDNYNCVHCDANAVPDMDLGATTCFGCPPDATAEPVRTSIQ